MKQKQSVTARIKIDDQSKSYINKLKGLLDSVDHDSIGRIASLMWKAYLKEKKFFIIGNGGSASTASHMMCDFAKTIRGHTGDAPWKAFKIIALTDNVPLITAWSNDTHYTEAYTQKLSSLCAKGDVLIAISSSGNSKNIIQCVEFAKQKGLATIGISGFGGGRLSKIVDVSFTTPSDDYGPVEDMQLILNHLLVSYFKEKLSEKFKGVR